MKIGFDVDGVLTDLSKFQLEYGKKFFQKKYGMPIVNKNGSSIKEIFSCTDDQEYKFWKKYIIYYSLKWPMRPGAAEVINKLQQDGNEIYIITSRIKTSDNDVIGMVMRNLLKSWFKKNNIYINDNRFKFCSVNNSAIEKSNFCVSCNIDCMIEDDVANISQLSLVTNVVRFENCYNNSVSSGIISVKSFYDLYDYLSRIHPSDRFIYLKYNERLKLSRDELVEYYECLKTDSINRKTMINMERTESFYVKIYPCLKKIFDLVYPYKVIKQKNIQKEDGAIYVINHRKLIDCPLAMSVIGRKPIHVLLKGEFLNSKFAGFLKAIGCVFVFRENRDSEISASEELTKLVLKGTNILLCPEGTRNKTEQILLPFKKGAVTIAQKTGRPIIPIAISNNKGQRTISVGYNFYVDIFDDVEQKNEELRKVMENMLHQLT